MAALTWQQRNPENGIPNDLVLEYYSQRANAGMILTEVALWSQRG
jgi:2,4-dienoyl-CoA reductase-like NADH-dependent reductase (Old Yellow Enzyme family)